MLYQFSYFNYLYIRKLLLLKFNYINEYQIPKISSLKCYIPVKSLEHVEDMALFDAVAVLEFVTGQRVRINKLKAIRFGTYFLYESVLSVTLRSNNLFNFLYAFKTIFSFKFTTRQHYITLDLIDPKTVILSLRDTELLNFDFWFYKPFKSNIFFKFTFSKLHTFRELKMVLSFWGFYI